MYSLPCFYCVVEAQRGTVRAEDGNLIKDRNSERPKEDVVEDRHSRSTEVPPCIPKIAFVFDRPYPKFLFKTLNKFPTTEVSCFYKPFFPILFSHTIPPILMMMTRILTRNESPHDSKGKRVMTRQRYARHWELWQLGAWGDKQLLSLSLWKKELGSNRKEQLS